MNLKTYYYTKDDHGWEPESGIRFGGIDEIVVADPADADVILVSSTIRAIRFRHGEYVQNLRYIARWPEKHVLWDICDNYDVFPGLQKTSFIRCVVDQRMMEMHPKTMCQPWPTADLKEIANDRSGIVNVVSFCGWDSGPLRHLSAESCRQFFGTSAEIHLHEKFHAYYPPEEQKVMRQLFLDTLRRSWFILSPPSIYYPGRRPTGFVPYRFYEAMSAGRIPVHVGLTPILPFEDRTEYHYVHVTPDRIQDTVKVIKHWLNTYDLDACCAENRKTWETWLNPADWERTHRIMVEELMQR